MAFVFPIVGAIASAAGTVIGAIGQIQAAKGQQQALEFQAKQEEQQAKQARAEGQRAALEKRREGDLLLSRRTALAAGSGGGATDPTVLAGDENVAGRSEYGALMETYKGENRARGLIDQAAAHRYQGEIGVQSARTSAVASMFSATGTLVKGFGSAYDRYNGVSPYPASYPGYR